MKFVKEILDEFDNELIVKFYINSFLNMKNNDILPLQ